MQASNSEHRNWKREPLVWMLIAIPFSAVIMGVVITTLAVQSYSGLVIDDYYRKGKQINLVLARDRLAHELGLAADFSITDSGKVAIRFAPGISVIPGDRIELRLVHATRPGLDQLVVLDNNSSRLLEADLPLSGRGRWNVFLQTGDWRLTGSLQYPQKRHAELRPNYIAE
jgi:hypothetical protein